MSTWDYVAFAAVYLITVNLLTYVSFGWDKRAAQHGGQRISESNLLLLSAAGGTVGAIAAQQILRHKTRKEPFRTRLFGLAVVQAAFLISLTSPSVRAVLSNLLDLS